MAKDKVSKDVKTTDITINKDDIKVNNSFQELFSKIASNTYKAPLDNQHQIDGIEQKINSIINSDIDELKAQTGNDLTSFLTSTLSSNNRAASQVNKLNFNKNDDLESLFLSKDGSIFSLFSERFKNRMLLYHDLEIISEQLVELSEAINTTRDDIICSDDIGSEISRSINFSSDTTDKEMYDDLIEEVKRIEKEHKLHHKIREHIVPKALRYGEYFVYIIPESKLFEGSQKNIHKSANISLESTDRSIIVENLKIPTDVKSSTETILETISSNIGVNNSEVPLPLLENSGGNDAISDLAKYTNMSRTLKSKGKSKNKNSDTAIGFSDGVKSSNQRIDDWSSTKGCYIKLLDPKKIIPIKIMDYIIGYYYIHDENYSAINHNCKSNTFRFDNIMDNISSKSSNERNIITSIANSIVKSFDKKYLEENKEFKDLIMNSLLYNDMYKRKLHYQFIPADHICRFTINEDEHGNGQSMLYKSLFYAKLYLSLLIFNMVTYLSKSQDSRIHYIKTSGIDKNVVNKTMDVARQIKEKQISIADLMDYSSIYGKIGTGRDVFMPVGESGERGIEFDVISGQQVDMQPEFMEMLKQAFINGTGVPSVIMNYINEADYAKTLVMANAKQIRRVMLYQESFNEGITHMYKLILSYCTDIPIETIQEFTYTLMKPKSLPNSNLVDMIGYGDQMMDFFDKAIYGQYEQDESKNLERDEFRELLSRKILTMLPWEVVDEVLHDLKINVAKTKAEKGTESDTDASGSDDYGM